MNPIETVMERQRTVGSTSLRSSSVDYGYEDHIPEPRSEFHAFEYRRSETDSPVETAASIDASEISQSSPSQSYNTEGDCFSSSPGGGMTSDLLRIADYPPMPADRQARKQRSFRRRGGAVHASLLKSAVLASMSLEFDDSGEDNDNSGDGTTRNGIYRRGGVVSTTSAISLQSLQDALRAETSPRKRARRGRRTSEEAAQEDDDEDEDDAADDNNNNKSNNNRINHEDDDGDDDASNDVDEASNMFDTLRMSGAAITTAATAAVAVPPRREPPARRVSRKTSYDSRVSDYDDSEEGSDWGA